MRDVLFFATIIDDKTVHLFKDESHHCRQVMRCKVGDQLEFFNGQGYSGIGVIHEFQKDLTVISVNSMSKSEPISPQIHLACALTKNISRFEFILEKATELGVASIYPLNCDRSERRKFNRERLEKKIRQAAKQSKQDYIPILHDVISCKNLLAMNNVHGSFSAKIIAHYSKENEEIHNIPFFDSLIIAIGPEGDFSPDEIALCQRNNWSEVNLGSSRLRVETAAISSLAFLRLRN